MEAKGSFQIARVGSNHDAEELDLAARALKVLGYAGVQLTKRERPDIEAVLGGKRIGIELSAAHADEVPGVKGSALRRENEKQAGSAQGYWVPANPTTPLLARMRAKDSVARTFDWHSELWLLITTQHPDLRAVAATYLSKAFVAESLRSNIFDEFLQNTVFDVVCVFLPYDKTVFRWSDDTWHEVHISS